MPPKGICLYGNPGINKLDIKTHLDGALALNRTCINVETNNKSFTVQNAWDAMMSLDAALIANEGTPDNPTVVTGHSQFSQFACTWFRVMGPTHIANGTLDPANFRFYLTGCPEQKFTGACYLDPIADKPNYPGLLSTHTATCPFPPSQHGGYGVGFGIPPVMPWKVWFIANQYDGWADAPALDMHPPLRAIRRGVVSMRWYEKGKILCALRQTGIFNPDGPHKNYDRPFFDDPNRVEYVDPATPNVTYVWLPTYPIPPLAGIKWLRFKARERDEAERPNWDLAWTNRPVAMKPIDYAAVPSWVEYTARPK